MLRKNNIILRPPEEHDISAFMDMRNDTDLQRSLLAIPKPNNREAVSRWLQRFNGSNNAVLFTISTAVDNSCAGFIQITQLDTLNGTGWLGIAIHPSCQGKGYGSEALSLIEEYLKKTFNLRKILLEVDSGSPARELYKKNGFVTIGTMKQHFYFNNKYHDIDIMEKFI